MSSIYSEKTLGGLQTFKKYLFRFAVGVLILGIVIGAIIVLFDEKGMDASNALAKCISTTIIIGVMLMVTTGELKLIESRRASVQVLATIGLASNLLWALLWVIVVWTESFAYCSSSSIFGGTYSYCTVSTIFKIATVCTSMSAFGLICSAIMNMYEGNRKDVLLPLKITTATLAGYQFIYASVAVLADFQINDRFANLSGFAGAIWFFVWLVTLVISHNEKKRAKVAAPAAEPAKPVAKTDDELRAEIEEKVRREMIEKEVREKLEKEAKK